MLYSGVIENLPQRRRPPLLWIGVNLANNRFGIEGRVRAGIVTGTGQNCPTNE